LTGGWLLRAEDEGRERNREKEERKKNETKGYKIE
jgi:hypothetical protein